MGGGPKTQGGLLEGGQGGAVVEGCLLEAAVCVT